MCFFYQFYNLSAVAGAKIFKQMFRYYKLFYPIFICLKFCGNSSNTKIINAKVFEHKCSKRRMRLSNIPLTSLDQTLLSQIQPPNVISLFRHKILNHSLLTSFVTYIFIKPVFDRQQDKTVGVFFRGQLFKNCSFV